MNLGASENTAYVKALEKRDKAKKKGESSYSYSRQSPYPTGRGGGRAGRQRGGRADQGWGQPWGFQQPMFQQYSMAQQHSFPMQQQQQNYGFQQNPFVSPPPPPPPPPASLGTQRGRCLNCGSSSHFVKDCPTRPAYPLSLTGAPHQ